jgi:type IV secretory pathway VirB10-like protein
MVSNTRAFFGGVGTTFIILAIGFGGGLLLAKNVMEPTLSVAARSTAGSLPMPARIILPASAEAAQPPQRSAAAPEPAPQVTPTKEIQQPPIEQNESAKRAEHRKAESQQRERRKRVAERRAKREATRLAMQQQEQQHQRPGIMASGGDKDQHGFGGGFFGN